MSEKRRYKRLPLHLDIFCWKVGLPEERYFKGSTINVSTGGLLFHTNLDGLQPGDLVKFDLDVSDAVGLLEWGGTMSSFARVVRTSDTFGSSIDGPQNSGKYGIAVEFCQCPRFSM